MHVLQRNAAAVCWLARQASAAVGYLALYTALRNAARYMSCSTAQALCTGWQGRLGAGSNATPLQPPHENGTNICVEGGVACCSCNPANRGFCTSQRPAAGRQVTNCNKLQCVICFYWCVQIAKWLGAPVVLVVDCWAMARSAAAVIKGYAEFDPGVQLVPWVCSGFQTAQYV